MTFLEFERKFPTERVVIDHFIAVRYGDTLTCPHCKSQVGVYRCKKRPRYCECTKCNNSFSVFTGTIFAHSKVGIRKWFYAVNIFLNDKKGVSACNLQREIGGSYNTAWRMLHQIRAAMGEGDTVKIFKSLVEVDETYVGGKPRIGKPKKGKKGRGTSKTPVVGIIERVTKRVCARVMLPHEETGESSVTAYLLPFILRTVVRGATVVTDEFKGYNPLEEENYPHFSVNHSAKQYSDGNGVHTNNIENFWSILKRGIIGVYHQTSVKYLQRYVNEACFRRNNMRNCGAFDQLLKQSVVKEANYAWRVAG